MLPPMKLLLINIYRVFRFLNEPSSTGIGPENWLYPKSRKERSARSPILLGSPVNWVKLNVLSVSLHCLELYNVLNPSSTDNAETPCSEETIEDKGEK